MREIEIKLRARNFSELEAKLKAKGCELSEPISQHDIIYALKDSPNEFDHAVEGDVVTRIRYTKGKAILTVKQCLTREMDSLEYETEVSDPEAMDKILRLFSWIPVVEVKKARRKGKLGPYEICLDEVERLGTYIELEKLCPEDVDGEAVREELFKELESLGLSRTDEETRGYDTQMYQLEKKY
jgi:adenylate cyclase class 2